MAIVFDVVRLCAMALLPALLSLLIDRLRLHPRAQNMSGTLSQLLIGLVFALLAAGMEGLGVGNGAVRIHAGNAAAICAGLIFGAPAGAVAGAAGAALLWATGAESILRMANALSLLASGVCAAGIRIWMFDDKRAKWYYGLALGAVMEILHMLLIILTHMMEIHAAFAIVQRLALPMAALNGVAAMAAAGALSLSAGTKRPKQKLQNITHSFGRGLLAVVAVAFAITAALSWTVETQLSVTDAAALLKLNMRDVRQDIIDASDANLLRLTHEIARTLDAEPEITREKLDALLVEHDVSEINVIDGRGRIAITTNALFQDYDMADGAQSAAFLVLLDPKTTELVQSYQPISYDSAISCKYAGVALAHGGFVQVAYNAQRFQRDIDSQVIGVTKNRHIGDSGFLVIADEQGVIVSDHRDGSGRTLEDIGIDLEGLKEGQRFRCDVYGETSFAVYARSEGYAIVAVIPRAEVLLSRDVSLYLTVFMVAVIFAALYVLIYHLIKTRIVDNIRRINHSLAEITGGDLDVVVNVRTNEEFASLSDDINATVITLKRYIAEAAARIDKELEFARTIQLSALPGIFPPFPARDEFDIHALMIPAKEVGGDFYDFYLLDHDHLAVLVADVSGKGIPAAMFMMTAKTLIKGYAEGGHEVHETLRLTNEKLCENNEANMFVTAWMGVIDLRTGEIEFANAGHNPPLLRRGDGSVEMLRTRPGLVLACMEGMTYRKYTARLQPGDTLFLYTDGVTEANDTAGALYGEERLTRAVAQNGEKTADALCAAVKRDLDGYAAGAPQFDDITMLALRFLKEAAHEGTDA